MSTPAEILVSLSDIASGTPAEHLLAITTGGTPLNPQIVFADVGQLIISKEETLIAADDDGALILTKPKEINIESDATIILTK